MLKKLCLLISSLFFSTNLNAAEQNMINAYSFYFTKFNGEKLYLSEFKDKVILIVNTASQCGFTDQYKDLEALHEKYSEKGLVIIGVPCNDFGGQEPGSNEDIQKFVQEKYHAKFILVQKESIKGEKTHPFFAWANQKVGIFGTPKWNFHKYLISKDGELVDWFSSSTIPTSDKVEKAIEEELGR